MGYADALEKQDARIIPFHQENAGVSEARNTAMRHASGDYYRFVDVDDQLPPDSLEQLVRCAEKNQSDLVLAAYTEVLGTTRTVRDLGKCTDTVESAEFLRRLERLSNSFYYGVLWNKIFRGDIIRQHDLRFTSGLHWGEDFVFVMQYLEHAERMSYITTPVYDYFRNPNGAVVRQLVNCFRHPIVSIQARLTVYRSYEQLYRARGLYDQYKRILWRYLFRFTLRN